MSRKFINMTDFPDYTKLETYNGEMRLSLNMEAEHNYGDQIAGLYKGWFVPPTDARYRFYMTCDDKCKISIAPCPDTTSPLTELVKHTYHE